MNVTSSPAYKTERRYFVYYLSVAFALMILIVFLQCYKHGIFGTRLLLGWDSPGYVWTAVYVLDKGPVTMVRMWDYPYLYSLLLAFFGYFAGNVVIVERILPLFFGALLIYANSEISLRTTKNIHIAGLASLLTATSLTVLRVLSDLHRNLMALSLSFIALLLVADLNDKKSLKRRYLFLVLILFAIATAHFETYLVLSLSLFLYGCLTRSMKKLLMLILACAIPLMFLLLISPVYFFGYIGTLVLFQSPLTFDEVLLWTGGSPLLFPFSIIGALYAFFLMLRKNNLASLVFCWTFVNAILVVVLPNIISHEFARRTLLIMPVPLLLTLSATAFIYCVPDVFFRRKSFTTKKNILRTNVRRKLKPLCLATFLLINSFSAVYFYIDGFFVPFISSSNYEKTLLVKDFLMANNFSKPVVIFHGYPIVWYVGICRNYLGSELGEHFAYYGCIENLFRLIPTEPEIDISEYVSQLEKHYLTTYYQELTGGLPEPVPPLYVHELHIRTTLDLASHPIVVVAPNFYNGRIPYYMKPFYVGDGIYVIPPHSSINFTEVFYGPEITAKRDSTNSEIKSQYSHIDPYDPSLIYLKLNASSGYQAYNLTNLPTNTTFAWMEQGGDPSYPEQNPLRLDGTKATIGNDPTESPQHWTTPTAEQEATFQTDTTTKKEGNSSLKITGKTDSSGNLAIRYQQSSPPLLDLYTDTHISIWAKATEPVTFSITLTDTQNKTRTYWDMKATDNRSATTNWKRLTANLNNYTSQTPGFDITAIKHIDFYVYSTPNKNITFWIDDPTTDTITNLNEYIYKDRVPTNETLIIYFYTIDTSNTAETNKNDPS